MTLALTALTVAGLLGVALRALSGRAADWLGPRRAVPVLALGSVALAAAGGLGLTALTIAMIAASPLVGAIGGWSAATVHALAPIPAPVGLIAAAMLTVLLSRTLFRATRILVALFRSERACRRLRRGAGPVLIVDDGADAYTLAGVRGCVVLSRALWDRLDATERRTVLAHELSHLRHRHHLYLHAVDLAVGGNPLLRTVADAVRLGIERWADEDAALTIGDRRAAARALARTALIRNELLVAETTGAGRRSIGAHQGLPALGATHQQVTRRATALLAPPPTTPARRALALSLVLASALILGAASVVVLHHDLEQAHRQLTAASAHR